MSDIVEDLRYAEHVTDERVMKVMDAGADTIESLRQQLAASQLREQQLRQMFVRIANPVEDDALPWDIAADALALPQDTTALEAMIAKAGEVMRERCAGVCWTKEQTVVVRNIRALPGVTMEDLK